MYTDERNKKIEKKSKVVCQLKEKSFKLIYI